MPEDVSLLLASRQSRGCINAPRFLSHTACRGTALTSALLVQEEAKRAAAKAAAATEAREKRKSALRGKVQNAKEWDEEEARFRMFSCF